MYTFGKAWQKREWESVCDDRPVRETTRDERLIIWCFSFCVDKFLVIINDNCHLPPAVTSGLSAPLCPTSSCLQLSGLSAPPPVSHFVMSSVVRVVCPPMSHFVLSSAVRIICPPLSHFVLSSVVRVVCPPVSHFVLSSVVRVVLHCQKQEAWTVLNTLNTYL